MMWLAPSPLFAKGAPKLNVADVFSTDLYTGNSSTQTITNGIDLAGEGGLVWGKSRSESFRSHNLADTARGGNRSLSSNLTNAEVTIANAITFNSDGFSFSGFFGDLNVSGETNVAWTFRRAPKFFDVVTYTGDGVAGRTVAHNLGVVPGMIVVKRRDSTGDWSVWHRSIANTEFLKLNAVDKKATGTLWNNTTPTDSVVTLGNDTAVNANTATYVMYLFGHEEA